MTPEQRRRAGRAVGEQLDRLGLSIAAAAYRAGVSRRTLSDLINGLHWPTDATQDRVEDMLGWKRGELIVRAACVECPLSR